MPSNPSSAMCSQHSWGGQTVRPLERSAAPDSAPRTSDLPLHRLRHESITYLVISCLIPYCSSEFLPDQVSYLQGVRKLSRSKTNSSKFTLIIKSTLSHLSSPLPLIKFLLRTTHKCQALDKRDPSPTDSNIRNHSLSASGLQTIWSQSPFIFLEIMRIQRVFIGAGYLY